MIKYMRSDVRNVAPDEAKSMLEMVDEHWQRKLVKSHVAKLAIIIGNGRFYATGGVAIADCPGGARLANGQHTLKAVIASGKAVRCLVERFKCDSDDDYVQLFHAYDTENRKRTFLDSAQQILMGCADDFPPNATPKLLNTFRSGVELAGVAQGMGHGATMRFDRFDILRKYREPFELFLYLNSHVDQKVAPEVLHRASVVAAIVLTQGFNKDQARQFWYEVVTTFYAVQEDQTYAPLKLNTWLRSVDVSGGHSTSSRPIIDRLGVCYVCLHCWECYLRSHPVRTIQPTKIAKMYTAKVARKIVKTPRGQAK